MLSSPFRLQGLGRRAQSIPPAERRQAAWDPAAPTTRNALSTQSAASRDRRGRSGLGRRIARGRVVAGRAAQPTPPLPSAGGPRRLRVRPAPPCPRFKDPGRRPEVSRQRSGAKRPVTPCRRRNAGIDVPLGERDQHDRARSAARILANMCQQPACKARRRRRATTTESESARSVEGAAESELSPVGCARAGRAPLAMQDALRPCPPATRRAAGHPAPPRPLPPLARARPRPRARAGTGPRPRLGFRRRWLGR